MTGPERPERWNRHGLRVRAVLLGLIGMLVPLLIVGGAAWESFRVLSDRLLRERGYLARSIARHVEHELGGAVEALHGTGRAGPGVGPDARTAALRAAYLQSPLLAGVFLLAPDGALLWCEPAERADTARTLSRLPAIAEGLRSGRSRLSGTLITGASPLVWIAVPSPEGTAGGLTGALLDPARPSFRSLLPDFRFGRTGAIDLVNAEGALLSSSSPAPPLSPAEHGALYADLIHDRRSATAEEPDSRGVPEVVAFAPLELLPWGVAIRQPADEAFAPAARLRWTLLGLIPVLFGLMTLLARAAARSLSQPLAVLTESAERIAAGDLTSPVPGLGTDEVGRLGRSFEVMREALGASMDEVSRINAELERRVAERTRELSQLYRRLLERDEWRGRLLQKVISAQEDERKRLARELHDDTCQSVTAVVLGLDTALASPEADRERRLTETRALAQGTLAGLHRLIFDLRPSVLDDLGLFPAIRWYAGRILSPRGVSVRFELDGTERRLPVQTETAVFRIVQEALNNVARHAEAETVLIQVFLAEELLTIEIEDDGKGFDPADVSGPAASGRGLGLLGIRERVELLGGTVQIDSTPGHGTRIVLTVPVRETSA